jgi:glycosyltransferase involved in cell wall biosynthesis
MKNNLKKKIVISAVNLTEGGGREVLLSVLRALSIDSRFFAIVLVNNKAKSDLVRSTNIRYLQVPSAKKSWLNRLLFEYFFSRKLSKRINADIWLSLHDITPNVIAHKRYVYCHNIAPFYSFKLRDVNLDLRFSLFVLFYKWVYRINLNSNSAVFVQQKWIADQFKELFKYNKCLIALPEEKGESFRFKAPIKEKEIDTNVTVFFYPTLPRTYKNLEVIFESVNILNKLNVKGYKVIITVSIGENKYVDYLINKYGHPDEIELCGRLSKNQMNKYYSQADILLFPSKLETWGLPIREAIGYNLALLLADQPYAKATSYGHDKVGFFNMESSEELSSIIKNIVVNHDYSIFVKHNSISNLKIDDKVLKNWKQLLDFIYKN